MRRQIKIERLTLAIQRQQAWQDENERIAEASRSLCDEIKTRDGAREDTQQTGR